MSAIESHPDGQWITLRKASVSDLQAIFGGKVETGRVTVNLPLIPEVQS